MHKHRDILLHETVSFPQARADDPLDELGIIGLTCLYNLFKIVEDPFSEAWTSLRSSTQVAWPPNTALWLTGIQQELDKAVPADLKCTKIQEADLRVTQQWLRLVVWQLSTASGCLSSTAHDESMTLLYPIKLSKDLADTLQYIDVEAMDVHGIALVRITFVWTRARANMLSMLQAEKLFDIAYSLTDLVALKAVETGTYEDGPKDHLTLFLRLVSTLRNGETKFVGLLQAKIREVLPTLAVYLGIPFPAPPATPTSTQSASSSGTPLQPLIPPLARLDSNESTVSSPYGSPTAMTNAPPLTSAPVRYTVGRQVAPSSSEASEAALSMSMSVTPTVASPTGSASETGIPESLGSTGLPNAHPSGYRPGTGFSM